ncbi:tRNA 2'-phosphotransferase 1 [Clonorchis sinensis]|uniref:2'-phosphotransferase n=1 Tax=Clonorchis sinensis TaxID=79923 RepID=A0A8T1MNS2_CLOSI|nr:tRNA 2'-phosphotransferase 1 [Clonorchis sinensis]
MFKAFFQDGPSILILDGFARRPPHVSFGTIFEISRYMYRRNTLVRLLRILRQPTTGSAFLGFIRPPHVSAGTMCQYHNTIYRRSTLLIRLLKILWSPTTGFALSRTHREKSDVLLSKKLAWVLRHGAAKVGLNYTPGGFLYLDELLGLAKFRGVTETEIRHVVDNNDKRRFEMCMDPESGRMKIRAFQGHSVQISHPAHTLITIPSEFPTVLHGTYFRNWEKIRTEGLKRMGRTHIHMAADEPGDCGVISGVRANVEVLIYIDLARAMADGYRFYVTPNRVILTEGNTDGCLPPKYFKAAYQLRPRRELSML